MRYQPIDNDLPPLKSSARWLLRTAKGAGLSIMDGPWAELVGEHQEEPGEDLWLGLVLDIPSEFVQIYCQHRVHTLQKGIIEEVNWPLQMWERYCRNALTHEQTYHFWYPDPVVQEGITLLLTRTRFFEKLHFILEGKEPWELL